MSKRDTSNEVQDLARQEDWQVARGIPSLCQIGECFEKSENYILRGENVLFLCRKHFHEYLAEFEPVRA